MPAMNISGVNRIRVLVLAVCVIVIILYIRFFFSDELDEVNINLSSLLNYLSTTDLI